MAQFVNLSLPNKAPALHISPSNNNSSYPQNFAALRHKLRCNGRFSCLFSDNRKQEQTRKALDNALGANKEKFEKWDKEIKKREEAGGGGDAGGGGWFGWGGRFGWSNGDNFWQETHQTSLAVLGMLVLYLLAAKGDLLLVVILNPLLFALRGTRNSFTYIMSLVTGKLYPASDAKFDNAQVEPVYISAKDRVVKKWGSD